METKLCKSCCASKGVEEFDGFKTCNICRQAKRKCYEKNKNEYNQIRREERAKGSRLCEECGHRIRHENWDAHFHYALHPNSELNILMKGYFRRLGDLKKEGRLSDGIQEQIKAEYKKQKLEIRKRLNKQFPNKFVDEEETVEPTPDPEQHKPDIDTVFNHVHQLLMNDEFLEDYFLLFGKHKGRIIVEIPVDVAQPKATTADT